MKITSLKKKSSNDGLKSRKPFFLKPDRIHSDSLQNQHFFNLPDAASYSGGIQAKLTVGKPGDKYEQEADAAANQVMRMREPLIQRQPIESDEDEMVMQKSESSYLQMKCAGCEKEQKSLHRKPLAGNITPFFQRQETNGAEVNDRVAASLKTGRSNGKPLPDDSRNWMENRFGTDFSRVRVHTDSHAIQMSRELNAQAFTHGSDIYFNQGKYNPSSSGGKHLLAHELTHVVQQRSGSLSPQGKIQRLVVIPPGKADACPPGYTICDFIHQRITMEAQYALAHLYRQGGEDCMIALSILGGAENGELKGVYMEDQGEPALMARRNGSSWWLLIPEGQGAIVSEHESPPMMVIEKRLANNPVALADALKQAWNNSSMGARIIEPAPPSLTPCAPEPEPPEPEHVELPEDKVEGRKCPPPSCDPSIAATVYAQCGVNKHGVPIECLPVSGQTCGVCEGTSDKAAKCLKQNEATHKKERQRCKDDYSPGKVAKYSAECLKAMAECYVDKPSPGKLKSCLEAAGCFVDPEPLREYQDCLNKESKRYMDEGKRCKSLK